jgi:hypothetical protein
VFFEGAPSLGFLQGQGFFADAEDPLTFLPDGRFPRNFAGCRNALHSAAQIRETAPLGAGFEVRLVEDGREEAEEAENCRE